MNILVIAKIFHPKNRAIAIQMRRMINALIDHGHHNIILITEGIAEINDETEGIEIINVPPKPSWYAPLELPMERFICSLICLRKNRFIEEGFLIAQKIVTERNIDLVLTVSTPMDSHIIGLMIKRKYHIITWVTFFSDMWPSGLLPKPYKTYKLLSILEKKSMQDVVGNCDGLITSNKYTIDLIKRHFQTEAQFSIVPFCLNKHDKIIEQRIEGYIVHSGNLYKERISNQLVEAISELVIENKDFKGLTQLGGFHPKLIKIMKRNNCKNIFLFGCVPENIAGEMQNLFKTGIIIEAPFEQISPFMPSKITDSVQLNKNLVIITPNRSFLRDFAAKHNGIFCSAYDKNEIKSSILKALYTSEEISSDAINYFHPSNIAKTCNYFFNSLKNCASGNLKPTDYS